METNKVNMIKVLKGKPMEYPLYSPMYGKLWLAEVDEENGIITCYKHELVEGDTRANIEQEDTVAFYSNGTTGDENFNVTRERMLFLMDERNDRKELLLKDLCARLPYGVIVETYWNFKNKKYKTFPKSKLTHDMLGCYIGEDKWNYNTHFLPFLRPLSSMTDEEAMEVAELWGLEDILSVSVKENYISIEVDDGVAASETYTIWFNEIVSSIELLDWLNAHHFDYRGLIEKGVAIAAPKGMYNN